MFVDCCEMIRCILIHFHYILALAQNDRLTSFESYHQHRVKSGEITLSFRLDYKSRLIATEGEDVLEIIVKKHVQTSSLWIKMDSHARILHLKKNIYRISVGAPGWNTSIV